MSTHISIVMQYSVTLETMSSKYSNMRIEPNGFTNNRQIPITKSVMDYIFRYLSLKFLQQQLPEDESDNDPIASEIDRSGPAEDVSQAELGFEGGTAPVDKLVGQTVEAFFETSARAEQASARRAATAEASGSTQEDAPPCSNCGSITVRSGACYSCPNCGSTTGCG